MTKKIEEKEEKNCLNCFNEKCQIPKYERFAIDENNKICGYNCLAWEGQKPKVKTLGKINAKIK